MPAPLRRRLRTASTLAVGLAVGWAMAHQRAPKAGAVGVGDRRGDWSVATGPVALEHNPSTKTQAARDALFFLDYTGGRLLASVPMLRQSPNQTRVIDTFVDRDLALDFKIEPEGAASPRFAMAAGSIGSAEAGRSLLFVLESASRQVGIYRVQPRAIGTGSQPRFDLMEVRPLDPPGTVAEPAKGGGEWSMATAPISLEYDEGTRVQAPREALFLLDHRGARLMAAVPSIRQSVGKTQVIDGFADRDLVADFKLDPEQGPAPRFLMVAGSLGTPGNGWSPLFVFEAMSRRVAAYRVQSQAVGAVPKPKLDLLEVKSFAPLPPLPEPGRAN